MAAEHKPSVAFRINVCFFLFSSLILCFFAAISLCIFTIALNVSWLVIIPFSLQILSHSPARSLETFFPYVCMHGFFRLSFGMRVFGRSCSTQAVFSIYTHYTHLLSAQPTVRLLGTQSNCMYTSYSIYCARNETNWKQH